MAAWLPTRTVYIKQAGFPGLVIIDKELVSLARCDRLWVRVLFLYVVWPLTLYIQSLCCHSLEIQGTPDFHFTVGPENDVAAIPGFISGLMTKEAFV